MTCRNCNPRDCMADELRSRLEKLADAHVSVCARLAQAGVLLREAREAVEFYDGNFCSDGPKLLPAIDAFLTPVSQRDHDCRFYMRFDGMCSFCGKQTAMDIQKSSVSDREDERE